MAKLSTTDIFGELKVSLNAKVKTINDWLCPTQINLAAFDPSGNFVEGRGLVVGYSGSDYPGIGYNVRHTATAKNFIIPNANTASYMLATAQGFNFYSIPTGSAGRSVTLSSNPIRIVNDVIYASAFRGKDNVAGTGEAIHCPAGIYSQGTNYLYGPIITNNNSINAGTGTFTCGAIIASRTITATSFSGSLSGNASTATKLAATKTIAGVAFDGSSDIAIPFANLSSKPTTLAEYGITDAILSGGAWKPTSLSSATRVTGIVDSTGKGEFGLAYSGEKIHPYANGWFYQDEGRYRVIDDSDSRLTDARTPLAHTHTTAQVTGLDTALAEKASLSGSPFQAFNTSNLSVTGDVKVTGDVFYDLSDIRMKTEFENIDNIIDKIMKIDTGYYYYNNLAKTYGYIKEDRQIGVKAQQIKELFPEAVALAPFDNDNGVSRSGENYLTVRYEKLVPVLIEALKAQQTEIELLKEKVGV